MYTQESAIHGANYRLSWPKSRRIRGVEKAEIKQIGDYPSYLAGEGLTGRLAGLLPGVIKARQFFSLHRAVFVLARWPGCRSLPLVF